MKIPSSQANQPISQGSASDWQILGEIELSFGVDTHSIIKDWLSDVLAPLTLHSDFQNEIWISAQDAVARASQAEMAIKYQYTRILIYVLACHPVKVHTWGFFRIEKTEPVAENGSFSDHSIEFYLFPEGQ